jgi:hypothetical protein
MNSIATDTGSRMITVIGVLSYLAFAALTVLLVWAAGELRGKPERDVGAHPKVNPHDSRN